MLAITSTIELDSTAFDAAIIYQVIVVSCCNHHECQLPAETLPTVCLMQVSSRCGLAEFTGVLSIWSMAFELKYPMLSFLGLLLQMYLVVHFLRYMLTQPGSKTSTTPSMHFAVLDLL